MVDKALHFEMNYMAAMWCAQPLSDIPRAKIFAAKAKEIGNDDAEATEILLQLSLDTLTALTDKKGRNCRKEAVETLLHMGFPHALKVSPEDFEFARRYVAYPTAPEGGPTPAQRRSSWTCEARRSMPAAISQAP